MSLELWNKLKRVPPESLKTIGAGRLKGKSDINPQWRLKIMTETFGVCGTGWKYTIDKLWSERGDVELFAFALVSIYIREDGGTWSFPIPGIGGSALVKKESAGTYDSDEGYKMAVTDALSVAMKAIGVGADIYEGKWDGSKYNERVEKQKPTMTPKQWADACLKFRNGEATKERMEEFYTLTDEQKAELDKKI